MRAALCGRLGVEVPILQAPMGGAVGPSVVAAVSDAGGLGTLALSGIAIESLRRQIRETRALTSKPFARNLILEFPQEERLNAFLQEGEAALTQRGSVWSRAGFRRSSYFHLQTFRCVSLSDADGMPAPRLLSTSMAGSK